MSLAAVTQHDDHEPVGTRSRSAAASACHSSGRPAIGCITLGRLRPHPGALPGGQHDDGGDAEGTLAASVIQDPPDGADVGARSPSVPRGRDRPGDCNVRRLPQAW